MLDFCGVATAMGLPAPSGSIDAGDRLHLLGLYSGLSAGGEPEPEAERKNQRWNVRGGFGRQAIRGRSGYSR